MKAVQRPSGGGKNHGSARKATWRVANKGFCGPRSNYHKRPLPHQYTTNISVAVKDPELVEKFTICSWCGGRKK